MSYKHGHVKTVNGKQKTSLTYNSWQAMKNRCSDSSKRPSYAGVKVCEEWETSFVSFLEDMGPRPSVEYTIDRIDGNQGYYKENCRWATKKQQSTNLKVNVFHGKSVEDKCIEIGVEFGTFNSRRKRGYSIEEALSKDLYKVGHDGTAVRGEKNANAKLNAEKVLEIRRLHKEENWSAERLGILFGVTKKNIRYIINRHTWKHI